jgi:hypothetical protein
LASRAQITSGKSGLIAPQASWSFRATLRAAASAIKEKR